MLIDLVFWDSSDIESCLAGVGTFVHPHLDIKGHHNLVNTSVGQGFYVYDASHGTRIYCSVAWSSEVGDTVHFSTRLPPGPKFATPEVMELNLSLARAGVTLSRQAAAPVVMTLLPIIACFQDSF